MSFPQALKPRPQVFAFIILSGGGRAGLAAIDYTPAAVNGAPFEIFNLGNSHPVKLNELLDHLEKVTAKKAIRERKDEQAGDVPLTWADISKAGKLLEYGPNTALEDGLRKFVAWDRSAEPSQRL